MLNKILKYYNTIKYLKAKQIRARIFWLIKIRFLRSFIIKKINRIKFSPAVEYFSLIEKPVIPFNGDLKKFEFTFLNQSHKFKDNIDWNSPELEKLWLYNLQYQDYLLDSDSSAENFLARKKIILHWIENNSTGKGNGWEPYPLSLRIVNWIFFFQYNYDLFEKDESFRRIFLQNLYRQAAWLNYFLEFHLMANHLWANINALIFAGIFFPEQEWLEKGVTLLEQQIREQIDEDGGHFEKSPMYHAIILTDILDLINLSQACTNSNLKKYLSAEELMEIAQKMLGWLQAMTHPDGQIALFGDSAFGIAPSFIQLKKYYEKLTEDKFQFRQEKKLQCFSQSGYCIFRMEDQYLVVDAGRLGVDYQPGHAHCDYLSYEYSFKGKRFIVDSGVGNYLPTELRQKARSIYAHNTLVVNGLDQAEIWKAFRMGRRIAPGRINVNKDEELFEADYINALKKRFTFRHKRIIHFKDKKYFKISDTVSGKNIVSQENLIHPHPECSITVMDGKIKLSRGEFNVFIVFDKKEPKAELRDWFYTPQFGKIMDAKVIVLLPIHVNIENTSYCIISGTVL